MHRSENMEGIIEGAFIGSYGELKDAIYEAQPDATVTDVEAVMLEMAARLIQNNKLLVCKAVNESLFKAPKDCSCDVDDYAQDVFIHLLEHKEKLPGLLFPTNAKSSTVLYSLVKSRMRGVRKQLTDRHCRVSKRLGDIWLSGIEIAKPELDEQMLVAA